METITPPEEKRKADECVSCHREIDFSKWFALLITPGGGPARFFCTVGCAGRWAVEWNAQVARDLADKPATEPAGDLPSTPPGEVN
jgi:hypothetical protein